MTETYISIPEKLDLYPVAETLLTMASYNMIADPGQFVEAGSEIKHYVGPYQISAEVHAVEPGFWYTPATEETLSIRAEKRMNLPWRSAESFEVCMAREVEKELIMASHYANYPEDSQTVVRLTSKYGHYAQQLYIASLFAGRWPQVSVLADGAPEWHPMSDLTAPLRLWGIISGEQYREAHESQLAWAEGL